MKRNLGRLCAVMLAVCLLLSMAACADNESPASEPESNEVSEMFTTNSTTTTAASTATTSENVVTSTAPTTTTSTSSPSSKTTISTTRSTVVTTAATTVPDNSPTLLKMNDPALRYMGRTAETADKACLDWSASFVELRVRGGSVRMQLEAEDNGDAACVHVSVSINGDRTQTVRVTESGWYTLAEYLPENEVTTVRLTRLTEASLGAMDLTGIEITGKLEARPADSQRRIIWIGDSITAGYGNLAREHDPFTSETEDATQTYAALASDILGADYHIIAGSGYGVATSNGGSRVTGLMPMVYSYQSIPRGAGLQWDHSKFQPDLVVVNLGTNDWAGSFGSEEKLNEGAAYMQEGIDAFLKDLRKAHPDATIVWAYGLMIEQFSTEVRTAVEAFAKNDPKVHYIQMPLQDPADGHGAGGHPSANTHLKAAATLAAELKTLLSW